MTKNKLVSCLMLCHTHTHIHPTKSTHTHSRNMFFQKHHHSLHIQHSPLQLTHIHHTNTDAPRNTVPSTSGLPRSETMPCELLLGHKQAGQTLLTPRHTRTCLHGWLTVDVLPSSAELGWRIRDRDRNTLHISTRE